MKKTLLIAAAALAASVISSQAQVYSQNIVGYVNTIVHGGYNMINNPLNGSNTLRTTFPAVETSQVLFWNGVNGFNSYTFDTGQWVDDNTSAVSDNVVIAPGTGCFYSSPGSNTLSFVGSVAANSGSSTTNVVLSGFRLLGSKIPYAGVLTNLSLNFPQQETAQVLLWNGSTGYNSYTFDTGHWVDDNTSANADNVLINVGDGFFSSSPAVVNWVQSVP